MKTTFYLAHYTDEKGNGFSVNGAVGRSEEETISKSKRHTSVKNGAKMHWMESWESWED